MENSDSKKEKNSQVGYLPRVSLKDGLAIFTTCHSLCLTHCNPVLPSK